MKFKIITTSLLTIFILGLTILNAQPEKNFQTGKVRLLKNLHLTDEQQDQFNSYRFEHQEKAIELRAKMGKNGFEIQKLMNEDNIDQSKLMELTKANNSIRGSLHESQMEMWLNIYNILDNTQKEIWKDRMKSFCRGRKQMKGLEHHRGIHRNRDTRLGFHGKRSGFGRVNHDCWRH